MRVEAKIADKSANAKPAAIVDAAIDPTSCCSNCHPHRVRTSLRAGLFGECLRSRRCGTDLYVWICERSAWRQTGSRPRRSTRTPQPYAYLWSTDMQGQEGQAGSPIYDEQGLAIGILTTLQPGVVHMIPIEYADALLAQVRLREIKQEMQGFRGLRTWMEWSGEFTPPANLGRGTLAITYEKIVPGKPLVASIDILSDLTASQRILRVISVKRPLNCAGSSRLIHGLFISLSVLLNNLRRFSTTLKDQRAITGRLTRSQSSVIPHFDDEKADGAQRGAKKSQITIAYKSQFLR